MSGSRRSESCSKSIGLASEAVFVVSKRLSLRVEDFWGGGDENEARAGHEDKRPYPTFDSSRSALGAERM